MFDRLGCAADDHDVAFLLSRVLRGLAPDDAVRRTALTDAAEPRAARSAMLLPTAQACGGRITLCSSSRKAWLSSGDSSS